MGEIKHLTETLFKDLTIEHFGNAKQMTVDEVYNKATQLNIMAVKLNTSKEKIKDIIGRFQENLSLKGCAI